MHRLRNAIAALTAAHFAVGVWVATSVPGPLLAADDLAYLSMGRTLAAKGAAPLAAQPPYGFLYPLLLAPGWLFGLDESSMIDWARVLNALLGALLLPALYLLVRRAFDTDRSTAVLAAVVGSVLPAGLLTASIVWTENLIALLVVAALLAVARLVEYRSLQAGVIVVVVALSLYGTHPRMALASAVLVVSAAVLLPGRVTSVRLWAIPVVGAAALLAVELVRRTIQEATFGDSGTYFVGDLASRRGFSEIPEMIVHATGAAGYLVLASAGLAVLGVVTLWRTGPVGRVADLALGSILLTSGWFLTGVTRSDAYFHGRYIEVMAPVVVAAGVVGARRLSLPGMLVWITPGIVIAGFVGAWAGPGNNWLRPRSPVMMLGVEVSGAPFGSPIFEPGAAAAVGLATGIALLAAIRWLGPTVAGALFVVIVSVGVWSGIDGLDTLYSGSDAAVVESSLADIEVGRLYIDLEGVRPSVAGAAAWNVGLDSTTATLDADVTHLLLPVGMSAPDGAVAAAEFADVVMWELR